MRNSRLATKTVGILLASQFSLFAHAQPAEAEWCEQQWSAESSRAAGQEPPNYVALLDSWRKYEQRCAGTVAYEARLAIAYLFLNQSEKARSILRPLASSSSSYRYLVDFALLHADTTDFSNRTPIRVEDIRSLERNYVAYVQRYPDFLDAYAVLGGLQTTLDKHTEAIKSLEIGQRSSMDVSGVFRNLTISYTAVGRYNDAILAADKAYRLKKVLTSDQYFVYAWAKANASVGDFRAAETALRLIAAKKPEVRRDPDFKEAVDFVTVRMNGNKPTK